MCRSIAGGRLLVPSRVCRRNSVWACCCCRAVHTTADGRTQAGAPVLIDRPVQVRTRYCDVRRPLPFVLALVLADLCLALYQMMNASSPVWHAARVLAPRTRGATAFIQIPCCRGARRAGPATGHAASERRRVCRGERGHRAVHGSSSDGAMSVRARNAVKSSARLCVTELMRVCTTAARRWL